jgi:hypothetical protein
VPAHTDVLAIPAGIALLVAGTVVFVTVVTAMARAVDRLIDVAIAVRPRSAARAATRRSRKAFTSMPRTVVAAFLAGSLLFALAWSAFVLNRMRDLA